MKTWTQYCENMPNYATSARPMTAGGFNGTVNLGQANLQLVGQALQIDSGTHSIRLPLTSQQVQQIQKEVGSGLGR
jgi:hypothetical protein